MKKLNNLTVYLSKSLLTPESTLRPIREYLIGLGLNVTEYKEGTVYTEKLIKDADFILFIPREKKPNHTSSYESRIVYSHSVGKGQYSEALLVNRLRKHAFVFNQLHDIDDWLETKRLSVSKLANDAYYSNAPKLVDELDWKRNFGNIFSYYLGMIPDLEEIVSGIFSDKLKQYPLTPEEAFQYNIKLLLLS